MIGDFTILLMIWEGWKTGLARKTFNNSKHVELLLARPCGSSVWSAFSTKYK
jgi:hypothetical protein